LIAYAIVYILLPTKKIHFFFQKTTLGFDIYGRTGWNQQRGWRNWRNGKAVATRTECRGGGRKRSGRRCRTRCVQKDNCGKNK
jgi:hypothetical protein